MKELKGLYRGVENAYSYFNGCYSDPTVEYNGVSLCMWDVEEIIENDIIEEYGQERNLTEQEIEKLITKDHAQSALDLILDGLYENADYMVNDEMTDKQRGIIKETMQVFGFKGKILDFICIGFINDGMMKQKEEIIDTCKKAIECKRNGDI